MLHLKAHLKFHFKGHLKLHKELMVHLSVLLKVHPYIFKCKDSFEGTTKGVIWDLYEDA